MRDADTGAPATVPAMAAEPPRFPIVGWDRYTCIRFLGQGGMGKVFLAFDPRLQREVAIKFMHGDNPAHVQRLIGEARTQARVRHAQVCQVHEVGEVDGRIYIAMEHIAGAPLGELADALTLEQKVVLVRGAAEGLHEAHRVGVIHRDVKPSNILVARDADGALQPYVMDFGLARAVADAGLTATGAVVGTPRYMAPEQARPRGGLDRRVDVYGLGATLYHLITGAPPISGGSLLEVLAQLATVEPQAPRAIDPSLPADLEAIAMKCLEKDRAARYDSARALADDLTRFLNGEPVAARPIGAWYRLRKRLARHPRLVAAGVLAGAVTALAIGGAVSARREAAERERLAQHFTERVERVEASARYAALAPAHDVRGDRAVLRVALVGIAAEVGSAGPLARGPGRYALGRGCLALDDLACARRELEAAWQGGYRAPRVAYALALVIGQLYQRGLREAERIESRPLREVTRRELEHALRDPALGYLAASRGADVASPAYVAALVAFYEGREDVALARLDDVAGQAWFYEAPMLRGEVRLAQARALWIQGKPAQAEAAFAAGRAALTTARAIGESVPTIAAALGDLEREAMVMALYGNGDVAPAFARGLDATTRGLAIQPDHAGLSVLRAQLYRALAEAHARTGGDARDALDRARRDAARALTFQPDHLEARLELAQIERQAGELHLARNEDPRPALRAALAASDAIPEAARTLRYHENLGLIHKLWADHADQTGGDAGPHRDAAIAAYRRALALDDRADDVWINLGILYVARAAQPRAADRDPDLARALDALDHARALNPGHVVAWFYAGTVHELCAQRARGRGQDPAPSLARALDAYQHGLAINPRLPHLHNGIGIARLDQARAAWDRGVDPAGAIAEARAAFERAITVAPEQAFGYDNLGGAFALDAQLRRARGLPATTAITAALAAASQALARLPDHPTLWADLALAHALEAADALDRGGDPAPALARATAAIAKALAANPEEATAHRASGDALALAARREPRKYPMAEHAYQRAIALAPDDPDARLALGQLYAAWARAAPTGARDALRARGRAIADAMAEAYPARPDVAQLRAQLASPSPR